MAPPHLGYNSGCDGRRHTRSRHCRDFAVSTIPPNIKSESCDSALNYRGTEIALRQQVAVGVHRHDRNGHRVGKNGANSELPLIPGCGHHDGAGRLRLLERFQKLRVILFALFAERQTKIDQVRATPYSGRDGLRELGAVCRRRVPIYKDWYMQKLTFGTESWNECIFTRGEHPQNERPVMTRITGCNAAACTAEHNGLFR